MEAAIERAEQKVALFVPVPAVGELDDVGEYA